MKRIVLYVSSQYKVSKSIAFAFGGVQKDVESKHLLRQSIVSSCSEQSLSVSLSIQELAKSMRYDHAVLFTYTLASSDVMRMYRPL